MPATKVPFANYTSKPQPARVYLDSNFAFRLLYYDINKGSPAALRQTDKDCFNFYNVLVNDHVELVGSIYTFSETLQTYCFKYPGGMYDLADQFLQSQGVKVPKTHECFKRFLNQFNSDCKKAWNSISYRVGATEEFFDQYGIKLLYPLPSPALTNITRSVVNYASILKDFVAALEATDALHLSIASYLNSDAVVSLDSGFLEADGVVVYAPH